MSKQHPYPQHVLHKVAAEIRHSVPTLESWEARALAQSVLTTLWNADQPSTLSADEARTIWDLAVAAYRDAAEQRGNLDGWDEALELLENNSEIDQDAVDHYKSLNPNRINRADRMEGDDAQSST